MQDVTLWTNKLLGLGIVTLKVGEDEDFEDNEGDNDEDDKEEDDEEGFE